MTTPTIAFSTFVRRQTPSSPFSHFEISEAEVLRRVRSNFDKAKPGYRDGVVLVPVEPDGFFSSTVTLSEGDRLEGRFTSRGPSEMPRKQTFVTGKTKQAAAQVDVVLYRADVLAEDGSNTTVCADCHGEGWVYGPLNDFPVAQNPCPSGCTNKKPVAEWEIISINATPTDEPQPIDVMALLANHFHVPGSNDGGTSTGMTDAEFVSALRKSYLYWRDKAMCG